MRPGRESAMKIGIISDTHDQIERVKKAVTLFNKEKVDLVIHCGDIVSPFTLQFYGKLKCPMKVIFGNNTGDLLRHLDYANQFGLKCVEFIMVPFLALEIDSRKIGVYHGDSPEITEALIRSKIYDCIFSGHNHIASIKDADGVLYVNPGTLMDKHRVGVSDRPTISIYNTKIHKAKLVYVE